MRTVFNIRVLAAIAAACALPIIYLALFEVASKLTRFEDLQIGDAYYEGHPQLGWKKLTKVDEGWASAFRQTCSGRQHNDFVPVRDSHKVRKVEKES